jgi:hypothetical protein
MPAERLMIKGIGRGVKDKPLLVSVYPGNYPVSPALLFEVIGNHGTTNYFGSKEVGLPARL